MSIAALRKGCNCRMMNFRAKSLIKDATLREYKGIYTGRGVDELARRRKSGFSTKFVTPGRHCMASSKETM